MLLCLPALACAQAGGTQAAAQGFVEDARWSVLTRTVYDHRQYRHGDRSNGARNAFLPRAQRRDSAEEWGLGLMGSVESGFTPGWIGVGLDAQLYLAQTLGGDDYSAGKARLLALDDDGYLQDRSARGGAALKLRMSSTVLKVGEQRVKSPVFASSDSRLLPETAMGWLVTSREIPALTLQAGHFTHSADRNARRSNNPLIVNYSNAPRGESFDFAGGTYAGIPNLAASLYLSTFRDTWRGQYAGVAYTVPLADKRSLVVDTRLYRSTDTGRRLAGEIDNTTGSLTATYVQGPHRLGLGYQKVNGDTPFDYVSRGAIWLGNAMQLSDFNGPRERSWQVRYEFDLGAFGVPGLSVAAAYTRGSGIDAQGMDPAGGYAWLGYGRGGRHWERDLFLKYTVQHGRAKGLMLTLRHDVHRNNKAQAELNADRIRVALEYPMGGAF
jgi:imipenem/basic amino acid-specific outer membrane pore